MTETGSVKESWNLQGMERFWDRNGWRRKTIEDLLSVRLGTRGDLVILEGDPGPVRKAKRLITVIDGLLRKGLNLDETDFRMAARMSVEERFEEITDILSREVSVAPGKAIRPKSSAQRIYLDLIKGSDCVFSTGPAGTGKTFLAMAMALSALHHGMTRRIILTRPAVEAGENLGFLPGAIEEKVHPYLRPLYDALFEMIGVDGARRLIDRDIIEIAPLAFMRGRTLGNAFVILDEAQNTTIYQMKMFLTRLGLGAKAVITGDITQIDLPAGQRSGLVDAIEILRGIDGIGFIEFGPRDVVRHDLVRKIIDAYAERGEERA